MKGAPMLNIKRTLTLAVGAAVLLAAGCYKDTPPCNPGSIDYPRCDPTQPASPHGAGGAAGRQL